MSKREMKFMAERFTDSFVFDSPFAFDFFLISMVFLCTRLNFNVQKSADTKIATILSFCRLFDSTSKWPSIVWLVSAWWGVVWPGRITWTMRILNGLALVATVRTYKNFTKCKYFLEYHHLQLLTKISSFNAMLIYLMVDWHCRLNVCNRHISLQLVVV